MRFKGALNRGIGMNDSSKSGSARFIAVAILTVGLITAAATLQAAVPEQAYAKADRGVIKRIELPKAGAMKVVVADDTSQSGTAAAKYQVRYSRSKSMSSPKYATVKRVALSRTDSELVANITGLSSGVKYYVQTRAYRKGWGSWSDATPRVTRYAGKLNSYSWAKIKSIANYIGEAKTRTSALKRARKYGLVGPSLALSGYERKTVKLSNGKSYSVCILDFWHDEKTSGKKAGITFAFTQSILKSSMNASSTSTNVGGWEASSLRAKLNGTTIKMLPADLRKYICTVSKLTNNVGETTSVESVTATADKLWLPSIAELAGSGELTSKLLQWSVPSKVADRIYLAEGSRYGLFTNNGVVTRHWVEAKGSVKAHWEYSYQHQTISALYNIQPSNARTLNSARTNVFLRSPRVDDARSFGFVRWTGFPYYSCRSAATEGVAPCFCL